MRRSVYGVVNLRAVLISVALNFFQSPLNSTTDFCPTWRRIPREGVDTCKRKKQALYYVCIFCELCNLIMRFALVKMLRVNNLKRTGKV